MVPQPGLCDLDNQYAALSKVEHLPARLAKGRFGAKAAIGDHSASMKLLA